MTTAKHDSGNLEHGPTGQFPFPLTPQDGANSSQKNDFEAMKS